MVMATMMMVMPVTTVTAAAPINWPFTLGQVLSWHFLHFFETSQQSYEVGTVIIPVFTEKSLGAPNPWPVLSCALRGHTSSGGYSSVCLMFSSRRSLVV